MIFNLNELKKLMMKAAPELPEPSEKEVLEYAKVYEDMIFHNIQTALKRLAANLTKQAPKGIN